MKRSTNWILSMAVGVATAAFVPSFARAAEEQVKMDAVPKPVHHVINEYAKDAKETKVYHVGSEGKDYYLVHYTGTDGKRMQLRIADDGKLLGRGETKRQREADAKERLTGAKTDAERAKLQEEITAQREAQDQADYQAWKEAQAVHSKAGTAAEAGGTFTSLKDMSEEYNATNHRRVAASALPAGARKTFDMETIGTSNVDYYSYAVEGKQFYSVHYDTGGDRRMVARVDETGKLLGKNELYDSTTWAGGADTGARTPAEVRPAATGEHAVSITLADVPASLQGEIKKETRGGKDLAYYKITKDGATYYTTHYTEGTRRFDLWLDRDGKVVSRNPTKLQPGDRNYEREELGR